MRLAPRSSYLSNVHAIAKALRALPRDRYLLAVSGGRDSMALLEAFVEHRPELLVAVATFDHGTGPAARRAVECVIDACRRHGVPVVAGFAAGASGAPPAGGPAAADGVRRTAYSFGSAQHRALRPTEASWRADRWRFLRAVADEHRATIATAHTLDDQAETVAMRILRGASARGLAAMAARTKGVIRPLLDVRRAEVTAYAVARGIRFVDDPTNASPAYLRNRLRADFLRAAAGLRPEFVTELCAVGVRAASWRRDLAELADGLSAQLVGPTLVIAADVLDGIDERGFAVLWPELAGRVGIRMDRRGVARAAAWAATAGAGQRIPLSGGASIERTARTFVIRPE